MNEEPSQDLVIDRLQRDVQSLKDSRALWQKVIFALFGIWAALQLGDLWMLMKATP